MKKKEINKYLYVNILLAVIIMIYFIIINFVYKKIEKESMILGLKILSGIVLSLGIIFLEIAYKKDSGKLGIYAIEILVLAGFTLSIEYVVESQKFNFQSYIVISSYVFSIYYILKTIVLYTKERREYLKTLSDVREIVDIKPTKKESEKRNK